MWTEGALACRHKNATSHLKKFKKQVGAFHNLGPACGKNTTILYISPQSTLWARHEIRLDRDSESLRLLSPPLYMNQRGTDMNNSSFYAQSHMVVRVTILGSLACFLSDSFPCQYPPFSLPQNLQLHLRLVFMNFLNLYA